MKKLVLTFAFVALALMGFSQEVSSRAKAMRMMSYARPEYMVKDIKVYTDTMTVYSLAEYVIYPIGKWENVEAYITETQLQWYREIGYKKYYGEKAEEVAVNTLRRLDGSFIDVYRSIYTGRVEMLAAKISDPEIVLTNGVHVGMTKEQVFGIIFKKFPRSYTADIRVLKVISGAGEVGQVYTFKGNKLRHIGIITRYQYY